MKKVAPDKQQAAKLSGEGGFSIVELLVAMVILVFVSVALLQTALVNIEFNTKNALRSEGVRVAAETMDEMRNYKVDIVNGSSSMVNRFHGTRAPVTRKVRLMEKAFMVTNTITDIGDFGSRMEVLVEWDWKGETYDTRISSVKTKKDQ